MERNKKMEEYYNLALEILEKLIALNTTNPPGEEEQAARYLADVLQSYGVDCTVQPVAPGRANLIGTIGTGGKSLLFDGHLDVVPANGDWTLPAFALTRKNGRLYGRGSCDMKGGVAAMCAAAVCIARRGGLANGRLQLLFSADEECANMGLHAYQAAFAPSDYAIIGEPTGMEVAIAHRGVSRSFIDIYGHAQHAALPQKADTAVNGLARLIGGLNKLNSLLLQKTHEVLLQPGVAVTMVQGYEKDNVVPAHVRVLTDFRLLPGMTRQEADDFLRMAAECAELEEYRVEEHFFMGGGQISSDDPFVAACCETAGALQGRTLSPRAFDASCEQGFLIDSGTKAVICGPGNLQQAHTADEYLEEAGLYAAVDFYVNIAEKMLNEVQP